MCVTTAPSAGITDGVQLWSENITDGNAGLHIMGEQGEITKIGASLQAINTSNDNQIGQLKIQFNSSGTPKLTGANSIVVFDTVRCTEVKGEASLVTWPISSARTDGDIAFRVLPGGVLTTAMTIDGATASVGIGTNAPGEKLEVAGNVSLNDGTTSTALKVYNTDDGGTNYEDVSLGWNSDTFEIIAEAGGTGTARSIEINGVNIDSSGNIGGGGTQTDARTTATETLDGSEGGKLITFASASATTFTIPANASVAFPVGTVINLLQIGSGQVTVAITSDTLNSKGSATKLTAQYSSATLVKTAATTWVLFGDITT